MSTKEYVWKYNGPTEKFELPVKVSYVCRKILFDGTIVERTIQM